MNQSLFLVALVVVISVSDFTVFSQKSSSILNGQRIVGGFKIPIEKAPWTVLIMYYGNGMCGGSIVSTTKILSAAHCTKGFNKKQFSIRAGSSKSNAGGQVRGVSKIVEHPLYFVDTKNGIPVNDIAILFLRKFLKLSPSAAVIRISETAPELRNGIEVVATGWGRTCESFVCQSSTTLQAVELPIVENHRCHQRFKDYKVKIKILPSMLCAGLENGGKDTCQGDSGGPITLNNTLVGIVSFGIGCARPKLPGVYTRVSSFRHWMKRYLQLGL